MDTKFKSIVINDEHKHPEFKLKWISDGGWRGYYDAIATKKSGWIRQKEHSDWITGDWEDAGDNAQSKQIAHLNGLADEYQKENKEMAVVFSQTSNCFSTGFDVFIRPKGFNLLKNINKIADKVVFLEIDPKTTAQDAI